MKTYHWIILLFLGMMASAWITHTVSQPEIDREPYWHPFELNPNLNLKALVDDGYRCVSMPCGQPQFVKTIGDTSIQYDVSSLLCPNRFYDPLKALIERERKEFESELEEELIEHNPTESDTTPTHKNRIDPENPFAERIKENPYYPYIYDDVKDCQHEIQWRVFSFKMDSLDSLGVVKFIQNKGGYIMDVTHWRDCVGGSFWVSYNRSSLYFYGHVGPVFDYHMVDSIIGYEFTMVTDIPLLDKPRMKRLEETKKEILDYYREQNQLHDFDYLDSDELGQDH